MVTNKKIDISESEQMKVGYTFGLALSLEPNIATKLSKKHLDYEAEDKNDNVKDVVLSYLLSC